MSAKTPRPALPGRRILLGVTGGIAAYKAAELVRRLKEAGAEVQVVMTKSARRFVAPLTFQALSGRTVRSALWDAEAEAAMGHIELARWADAVVVAPASANFLARLATGKADDLLSTLCLATNRPLFIAPAMNQQMWANKGTQDNLQLLSTRGLHQLGPGNGDQACGEVGPGRMLEPEQIRDSLIRHFSQGPLSGRQVVVTAGPTREAVDPVRFLTNRSSGKMGFAVAAALAGLGARTALIAGPVNLPTPPGVERIDVETAEEMCAAALSAAQHADIFVGAAAVADYRPAQAATEKLKKQDAEMSLALTRTEDILVAVRKQCPSLYLVGFAAETSSLEMHARGKLKAKQLDLVAANLVGGGRGFDAEDNALELYWAGGSMDLGRAPKPELARALAEHIAQQYAEKQPENA